MARIEPKPRVFLVGNARKTRVPESLRRMAKWLESKALLVGSDLSGDPAVLNSSQPDFVVALGGDGTILCVGQAMQHHQVPVIGVNLGKLGYLAAFTPEDLEIHLDRILVDRDLISQRMMLDVTAFSPAGEVWRGIAINDCVLRVGMPFRTVRLRLGVDAHPVSTIVSDGLVVSTPTGSTAHNMSCGGPILVPDVDAMILTPMNPHSLNHRPVVVSGQSKVTIQTMEENHGAAIVLDGQAARPLEGPSRIEIQKCPVPFQLVRHPDRASWDTLVQKLRWGQNLA